MIYPARSDERWVLCLYIAGRTPAAKRAIANIEKISQKHLEGRHSLEIVDLMEHPGLAEDDQIFAVPTLVRKSPLPVRKVIGDLSEWPKVMAGLDLHGA
jgi:circadian clock protein KaiB